MKILLIDPPFYRFIGYYNRYFPLGLSYLAAVLEKEGHEVLIYDTDCNTSPSKMDFTKLEDSYPVYLKSLKDDSHDIWKEVRERISSFKPDIAGISVWITFAASAFNTTCLNSAAVSPGMEMVPKSSFNMIRFGHGNKETSSLCLQVYVPYGLDPKISVQGTGKRSG